MKFIARQGQKQVILFAVLMLFAIVFDIFETFFIALFIISILIFRDFKPSVISKDPYAIYSPIGGKVSYIGVCKLDDETYTKIIIQKSIFSSGVIKSISDARIIDFRKREGLFICNFIKSSEFLNSRAIYFFKKDSFKFAIRIIAGVFSKKLYANEFKNVSLFDNIGFITSGNVVLFLPKDSKIYVSVGERVKHGGLLGNF